MTQETKGAIAALKINKDSKKVETANGFNLYEGANRVYSAANKPTLDSLSGTAANSLKLNNMSAATGAGANTIAQRDPSGDVNARLIRTTYTNQGDEIPDHAAMAIRIDNGSNNYNRYWADKTKLRKFLQTPLANSKGIEHTTGEGYTYRMQDLYKTDELSYCKRVILLMPKSITNSTQRNRVVGTLTCSKNGGNVWSVFDINVQSVYNSVRGTVTLKAGGNGGQFITCNYNGIAWYALHLDYSDNPFNNYQFTGQACAFTKPEHQLKVISYYENANGSRPARVIDAEINGSIANVTLSDVSQFYQDVYFSEGITVRRKDSEGSSGFGRNIILPDNGSSSITGNKTGIGFHDNNHLYFWGNATNGKGGSYMGYWDGGSNTLTSNGKVVNRAPQTNGINFPYAQFKAAPSSYTSTTGVTSLALGISSTDNYGWAINAHRTDTSAESNKLSFSRHTGTASGTQLAYLTGSGSFVTEGYVYANGGRFIGHGGAGVHPQYGNELNFTSTGSTLHLNYRQVDGQKISTFNFGNGGSSAGGREGRINAGLVDARKLVVSGGTASAPATIDFISAPATEAQAFIKAYGKSTYGSELVMQSGGSMFIGSGESAQSAYAGWSADTEQMYVCSDADVFIKSNMQAGAGTSKSFKFGADGHFFLGTSGQLGSNANETFLINHKVPNHGYRSIALNTDGNPNFYSVTHGNKKIYHEGYMPSYLQAFDVRSIKPDATGISNNVKGVKAFFTRADTFPAGIDGSYVDLLVLDTYGDQSGGSINAIAASKNTNKLYHVQGGFNAAAWSKPVKIYTEAQKPTVNDVTGTKDFGRLN
ncbi:hypothetical protein L4D00_14910 [Photobacterium swingsii]|uniref:hypothetical protein n=1 Tax=Photobacterium swingsii TaxID=680026 RepID=UPI003D0ACD97